MGLLFLLAGVLAAGSSVTDMPLPPADAGPTASIQEVPLGTWRGTLTVPGGELPLVFHIQASGDGTLTATMDSPAQGANGIPMSEVAFADGHLRIVAAVAQGEYEGDLSDDGTEFAGVWRQGGGEFDLTLVRDGSRPEVQATEEQRPIVGTWLGTLVVPGGTQLRMVFHIQPTAEGGFTATMDSPDQGATGIPVSQVLFQNGHLTLTSATVGGTFEGDLSSDGQLLEGEWTQSGSAFPLTLERTEGGVEAPSRPQEPKPPLPYAQEEVQFTNPAGGHTLAGTLTLPDQGAPHPAVVLISGSGPQDRDETVFGHRPFLVLADHLTREGIAVLRYDDRGTGESTGDFAAATSEDFVSDALAGVAFLESRSDIDGTAIGLIGHSEGGLVAPMAAVQSSDVAFIVLMAGPGVTGEAIVLEQAKLIGEASGSTPEAIERNRRLQERLFAVIREEPDPEAATPRLEAVLRESFAEMTAEERQAAGLGTDQEGAVIQTQVRQVNSPWFRFFLTYDPAPTLARVKVPVLAINGELDLQVPPKQNLPAIRAALAEGGNTDVTVMELPGLNHLFQTATTGSPNEYSRIEETMSPAALRVISDWILNHVSP